VHFGLGSGIAVDRIEIEWQSGSRQTLEKVPADRYLTVREP
jgi:ASPIC and UnbV